MIPVGLLIVAAACFGLATFHVSAPVDLVACGLLTFTVALLVWLNEPRIR